MQKIRLESVRLDTVTNICNVSDGVFDANKLQNLGLSAYYVPAAEAVVFDREGHQDHIVPSSHVLTMVSADDVNIDEWGRGQELAELLIAVQAIASSLQIIVDNMRPKPKPVPPGQDKPKPDKPEKRGPGRPPKA